MESVNFDRAADFYDATRGFPAGVAAQVGAFITQQARLSAEAVVLEVGIGTGRIALPLSEHIGMFAGADISFEMQQVLLEKRTDEPVHPVQADGYRLPYENSVFDAVVIVHVLHLVPDAKQILSEVKRVLKPTGKLLHCFNDRAGQKQNPVVEAWNKNRPPRKQGRKWSEIATMFADTNWQSKHEATFTYSYTETPQSLYDNVKNKVWSSMWGVSDEEVAPALEAITEAVNTHYDGNFNADMEQHAGFTMQVFEPPQ
ncbi:MAG: class I SAM-dependent methyltransferase [Chloroflexota bacterium]